MVRSAGGMRVKWLFLALTLGVLPAGAEEHRRHVIGPAGPANRPVPMDDRTFRATVLIRKGHGQGSGSIIASIPGETIVLTVAHVVQEPGDLMVELHRFNLGAEEIPVVGEWPRRFAAEILAMDTISDVALVRVKGLVPLPYVARLAGSNDPLPTPGTVVSSVGIDRGTSLSSWGARINGVARLDPHKRGTLRPYLVTDHAPDHGRSGGGLFLSDGRMVGVCVGRIDIPKGRAYGVFAPMATIYPVIDRAQAAPAIARSGVEHTRRPRRLAPPPVTETTNRPGNRSR